ncbi:MAG TPA: toll/interleukin-1 receptor domain-containing protein, partial [Candidatus Saccharimonadales bacterium]|nr:toll/interleukin-1 receptor domain-containing protein [Candidatus Saccharimonadales bacterium]
MSPNDKQIYISYAWGGESERIVNELDADLQSKGITIIRDKRNLGYKGMIRDFMQQIGRGYAVIVVISDKYLKSPNCMYELVEIAESKQFHDRIFPVVLADADIYRAATQLQYIKHWEDEIKALKEGLKVLDPTNLQGIYQKLNLYDRIRDNISNLIDILSDMNTLTPDMHENNNFATLIEMLKERLGEDTSVEEVKEPIVEEPVPPPVARRTSTTPKAPGTKKTKTAKPTARPAKAAKADSGNAYMNQVVRKLLRDDYQELPEEQFGDLRFSKALEKSTKYLFGTLSEYHRVVILEGGELDEDRFLELEKDIKQYSKELGDKRSSYAHVICLVLADSVSESLKELIQDTKPGKYAFAE